jgi:hypothetical protein
MQDPAVAVRVQGLVKSYAGMCKRVGCCHWKRIPPYHAVKVCWFVFPFTTRRCISYLEPNGLLGLKEWPNLTLGHSFRPYSCKA